MYEDILQFWFNEIEPSQWWKKDASFDQMIADRFSESHAKARQCEFFQWRVSPRGRLAEILLLDQFSRNIYRDTPMAFAQDSLALSLAQEAVASGAHLELTTEEKSFLYMPYMHSESSLIHREAERLYKENGVESSYNFELKHRAIIERFGRYPHRNSILHRESTTEELEFLKQPGSSF